MSILHGRTKKIRCNKMFKSEVQFTIAQDHLKPSPIIYMRSLVHRRISRFANNPMGRIHQTMPYQPTCYKALGIQQIPPRDFLRQIVLDINQALFRIQTQGNDKRTPCSLSRPQYHSKYFLSTICCQQEIPTDLRHRRYTTSNSSCSQGGIHLYPGSVQHTCILSLGLLGYT